MRRRFRSGRVGSPLVGGAGEQVVNRLLLDTEEHPRFDPQVAWQRESHRDVLGIAGVFVPGSSDAVI